MKRIFTSYLVIFALVALALFLPLLTSQTQAAGPLGVESATICRGVVARTPVDPGTSFPVSVGKLYCFTKIVNVPGPTAVTHVWYYGQTERARVTLSVNSPSWRTYSSKIIQAHEIGPWHVDVLGPSGEVLTSLYFEVTR
ncbi:MAG: DUF2914 domain-containing protein [Deltaproteobacteria bacterium]|nr:DUF2914 domain-containing protein [Deltaproteobacteria bacterium]MBW2120524.1 DUF2914 domain-containing protein [Deltaproteobacteria bacterium]